MVNKESVGPGYYDPHIKYIPMFKMNSSSVFASKTKRSKIFSGKLSK